MLSKDASFLCGNEATDAEVEENNWIYRESLAIFG